MVAEKKLDIFLSVTDNERAEKARQRGFPVLS